MRRSVASTLVALSAVTWLTSAEAGDCARPKPADCATAPARKVIKVVKVGCCKPAPVSKCAPRRCRTERKCSILRLPKLELPKLDLPKLNLFGSRKSCCRPAPRCSGSHAEAEAKKAPPVEDAPPPPPYEEKDDAPKPDEKKPAPAPPEEDDKK